MKKLLIIGSGGHARTILELAFLNQFKVVGIIDVNYREVEESIMGVPVIGGMDRLEEFDKTDTQVFIAIGENAERSRLFNDVLDAGCTIPSLLHPSAIVSETAEIESGVAICAGCIINPMAKISTGAIVNTGSILDHETKLGKFVHVAPGANIAGRVKVGDRTFIGIGASIIDKVKIGQDVIIGAGTVVLNDIPSGSKVVGVSKILNS